MWRERWAGPRGWVAELVVSGKAGTFSTARLPCLPPLSLCPACCRGPLQASWEHRNLPFRSLPSPKDFRTSTFLKFANSETYSLLCVGYCLFWGEDKPESVHSPLCHGGQQSGCYVCQGPSPLGSHVIYTPLTRNTPAWKSTMTIYVTRACPPRPVILLMGRM